MITLWGIHHRFFFQRIPCTRTTSIKEWVSMSRSKLLQDPPNLKWLLVILILLIFALYRLRIIHPSVSVKSQISIDPSHTDSIYKLPGQTRRQFLTYAEIEQIIDKQYQSLFGKKICWEDPKSFNEKLQVSKLYLLFPMKTRLADKVAVREWIRETIGAKYLIPLIGVYNSFNDIQFSTLPNSFVIKCNHDSGSVTICKDKSKLDLKRLAERYTKLLNKDYSFQGFEMHYRGIQPRIVIEQYMGMLRDYKFMCFHGKVEFFWVDFDRFGNHTRLTYDRNGNRLPFTMSYPENENQLPPPDKYQQMIQIAEVLSRNFEHVRVDLYLIQDRIFFSEMTFTTGNGFEPFNPPDWNERVGLFWRFNKTIRSSYLAAHARLD